MKLRQERAPRVWCRSETLECFGGLTALWPSDNIKLDKRVNF